MKEINSYVRNSVTSEFGVENTIDQFRKYLQEKKSKIEIRCKSKLEKIQLNEKYFNHLMYILIRFFSQYTEIEICTVIDVSSKKSNKNGGTGKFTIDIITDIHNMTLLLVDCLLGNVKTKNKIVNYIIECMENMNAKISAENMEDNKLKISIISNDI